MSSVPSVRLSNAEAGYAGSASVLHDVSITVEVGWTGVVGANGAGKSTLVAMLARRIPLRAGERMSRPREPDVVIVPQRVDEPDANTAAFFDDWSTEAMAWRSRLRLEDDEPYRWATLSFGERKRWQLAAALARAPDVLLVDEPTNHLDVEAVALVLDALRAFKGAGAVVSHDRRVLALCSRTIEVRAGAVRTMALGYDDARAAWQSEDEAHQREAAARRSAAKRRAVIHADAARAAQDASRRVSARTRMKSVHDKDARSVGARARADKAAARLSQRASAARSKAERAADVVVESSKSIGRDVHFDTVVVRRSRVAALVDATLAPGDTVIASGITLIVHPHDRVAIVGDNGAGKSTLMKRLIATCPLDDNERLYLPQELSTSEVDALVARVLALDSEERGALLARCTALEVDASALMDRRHASPGVARKVLLADALGRGVGAMFLDEPTNHLDLPSIERLERALAAYDGALVVVTHDDRFIEAIRAQRWHLGSFVHSPR